MFNDPTQSLQPGVPTSPGLDSLFTMFKTSPGIAILAVIAFILIFVVIFKSNDILAYFKEKAAKREEIETKKMDLEIKRHDDTMAAFASMNTVVANNSTAINSLEKTILVSEARTNEKFSDIKSELHDMKSDLMEKISSSAKETAHASKLDKIAASLDRQSGGEDAGNGDHK